jgi:ubiquinone/menaquinone biosynthesis C-methylase UbiE
MNDQADISSWQLDQDSAGAYEQYLVGRFFRRWARRLVSHSNLTTGERVLDAGCGTGIVARTVAKTAPAGSVIGLDINEGMLAEARRQDSSNQVTWESGSVEQMPFDDSTFDVVLSQQVLQFLADRAGALAEMHRALAPGGRLVFALLRGIEFNASYKVLADVLDRHAGREVGDMMRSPFAGPDTPVLRSELDEAGFQEFEITHDILDVRFPSPSEYLRQEAASSPLAGPLGELDQTRLQAMIQDLEQALRPFTDDRGVKFAMETRFVEAFG